MDVAALDVHRGGSGVEVLEFQFPDLAAVHCVGEVGAEFLHVELDHSAADLLVRGESYLDLAVLESGVRRYVCCGGHDLGHSGLVVGAEEGGPVGGHDCFSLMVKQFRELCRIQYEAGYAGQGDGAAVVVAYDLWLDVLAACVGSRVHVGDEAQLRHFLVQVGGDGGHHVAVFVQFGLDAHCLEFVAEHL